MTVRHIGRTVDSEKKVSIVFPCFVKDIKATNTGIGFLFWFSVVISYQLHGLGQGEAKRKMAFDFVSIMLSSDTGWNLGSAFLQCVQRGCSDWWGGRGSGLTSVSVRGRAHWAQEPLGGGASLWHGLLIGLSSVAELGLTLKRGGMGVSSNFRELNSSCDTPGGISSFSWGGKW